MNDAVIRIIVWDTAAMVGALIILSWIYMLWLKSSLRNKVYCQFLEATFDLTWELLPVHKSDKDYRPVVTSKADKCSYVLDQKYQRRTRYGFWFLAQPVSAQCYNRGYWEPVLWEQIAPTDDPRATAAMLKAFRNMAFIGEFIDRIKDELGVNRLKKLELFMLVAMIVLIVGLGGIGFMTYKINKTLTEFTPALERVSNALGK